LRTSRTHTLSEVFFVGTTTSVTPDVFVGPNASRGNGIVGGSASSKAKDHWDALVSVGGMISNKLFK
jgi:hypothetical protein